MKNHKIKIEISYLPLIPIAFLFLMLLILRVLPRGILTTKLFLLAELVIQIIFCVKIFLWQKRYRKDKIGGMSKKGKGKRKKSYTALLWVNGFSILYLLGSFGISTKGEAVTSLYNLVFSFMILLFGNIIILMLSMYSQSIIEDYNEYKKEKKGSLRGYLKSRLIVLSISVVLLFTVIVFLNLNAADVMGGAIALLLALNWYDDKLYIIDGKAEDSIVRIKRQWNLIRLGIVSFSFSYLIFEHLRKFFETDTKKNQIIKFFTSVYKQYFIEQWTISGFMFNMVGFILLLALIFCLAGFVYIVLYEKPVEEYRKSMVNGETLKNKQSSDKKKSGI